MATQNLNAYIAKKATNAFGALTLDQQNAMLQSGRHGKYYAATYGTPAANGAAAQAGSLFRCANPGATPVTLSAALATTYVGLCLNNPAGSGVNLCVKRVAGMIVVAPAGFLALGLITGWSSAGITAHTTSLSANIINGYVGAATSSGSIVDVASLAKVDSACTLVGTPLWDRWLACNSASTGGISFNADIDDDIIIPAGGYVAIGANVAGPTSGFVGSFEWEELAP